MAAVMELQPASSRRYVSLENPRTFTVALTRQQWRELDMRFVVRPTLDGPVLVFAEHRSTRADYLLLEILQLYDRYRRAWNHIERKTLSLRMRRKYLARVSLAIGYTWPGNPPGYIEFADGN